MLLLPQVFEIHQHPDMTVFVKQVVVRLLLAALLGGLIGLERQRAHRPAGLRTNMLICVGAALFTILSIKLAELAGGDQTRIAAQIITGIGFIGAGSIMQNKSGVTGLTTAATIFVVAAIGMACGGGLFLVAVFATLVLLFALAAMLPLEKWIEPSVKQMCYTVTGKSMANMIAEVNSILEGAHVSMKSLHVNGEAEGEARIVFTTEATREQLDAIMRGLSSAAAVNRFHSISCQHPDAV